jgi:mannose-1-phosphate guanylyltransferase/mannose-1-phosphate guanylyltransferase/mannose-6-phosphate isomerase
MIPVILSGGSGTRLWPLSRALHPKQFISLTEDRSLFQLTLERLRGLPGCQAPIVVCNEAHRFIVAEQCRVMDVKPHAILLEPVGRNTAPAIAAAACAASSQETDPLLLVLAADHVISDVAGFEAAIRAGISAADAGRLVTFGIPPTAPETGYGYIRAPGKIGTDPQEVAAFVEKPDAATAERYLASGEYLWNSGMFLFRASVVLAELGKFSAAIVHAAQQSVAHAKPDLDFLRLDPPSFAASPSDSIDYAVMEKTDRATVVPMHAGWSDVGAWSALWDVAGKDAAGNALRGDVVLKDVNNSYIHAAHRLVTVLGLDDVVVVETADAVMVTRKERVQDVKHIVEQLRATNRAEVDLHREVYRPWGAYDSIDSGNRYQVKRITVKPGHR